MSHLYQACSIFCHQIPDRSLEIGDRLLPLCARCTGIYAGFFISVLFQVCLRYRRGQELPPILTTFFCILLIAVLVVESLSSMSGFWESRAQTRFLLGLLGGMSIGILLLPILNRFCIARHLRKPIIDRWHANLTLLLITLAIYALSYFDTGLVFYIMLGTSIGGIVLFYLSANTVLASIILADIKLNQTIRTQKTTVILVFCLIVVELWTLKIVH